MKTFEDLLVWQKAKALYLKVYNSFKDSKEFYFKDQVCRASLSIVNNVAEGYERQTDKELRQFLYISKGSCGEVRSMIIIAVELKMLSHEEGKEMIKMASEISKMLSGFIKSINISVKSLNPKV